MAHTNMEIASPCNRGQVIWSETCCRLHAMHRDTARHRATPQQIFAASSWRSGTCVTPGRSHRRHNQAHCLSACMHAGGRWSMVQDRSACMAGKEQGSALGPALLPPQIGVHCPGQQAPAGLPRLQALQASQAPSVPQALSLPVQRCPTQRSRPHCSQPALAEQVRVVHIASCSDDRSMEAAGQAQQAASHVHVPTLAAGAGWPTCWHSGLAAERCRTCQPPDWPANRQAEGCQGLPAQRGRLLDRGPTRSREARRELDRRARRLDREP